MHKFLRKLIKVNLKGLTHSVQIFQLIKSSKKVLMMKIVLHPIHLWQEVAEGKLEIMLKLKSLVDGKTPSMLTMNLVKRMKLLNLVASIKKQKLKKFIKMKD